MNEFMLDERARAVQRQAREMVKNEVDPEYLRRMDRDEIRYPRELYELYARHRLMGLRFPEEYGGQGMDWVAECAAMEPIGALGIAAGCSFVMPSIVGEALNTFGTEEQKQRYLPELLTGEAVGSFAFTEPDTGTDPRALRTTAVREGDEWVINGEKIFITNSTLPGYIALFCKDVELEDKTTTILVPKDTPGYSTGKLVAKMGMHGMEVADVLLEDVRVPLENTVGGEEGRGKGFKILTTEIAVGKLGISAQCVGMAQAALDRSTQYAKDREQQGKPIARFQTIQWMIGEMSAEVAAARYLTYATAWEKSNGQNILSSAARTRLFASQVAHRAASSAMQVHGAFAYTEEYGIERIFRDMKLAEIYEGVNEIQRVIAAAELLR